MTAISDGRLRMQTRQGNSIEPTQFPELAEILETVDDVILDGELTTFTADGQPDFGATISRLRARPAKARALSETRPATMLVFDVLWEGRKDLRSLPYEQRRALLEGLGLGTDHWLVPPAFDDGPATVAASLAHGLEGVVAKRLSSPYVSGRSRHWIKTRHRSVIDAVIVGWVRTPSGGISILLAATTATGLAFLGRCTAPDTVLAALEPLAVHAPPVAVVDAPAEVVWVAPVLQVEVVAASRRPDGRLRQPQLKRVRDDQLG